MNKFASSRLGSTGDSKFVKRDRYKPRFNLRGKTFIISGSKNGLNFYNHYTGERFHHSERVHRDTVTCLQQFGKRYLLSAGNKTIKIHTLFPTPQEKRMIQKAHNDDIWCFCSFSPNFFLSGSKDHTVKIWKFDSEDPMHVFSTHHGPVNSIARTGTSHFASCSTDNTIQYCDLRSESVIASLGEHTSNVKSLSFDPIRNVLLSGSWDGTVRVWDVRTKFRSVSIFKHEEFSLVNAVRYFPKYYFISGDTLGWTRAWDLRSTARPVRASQIHKDAAVELIIAARERYATCSGEKQIRVNDFRTGDLMVLLNDPSRVYSMCYCNCVSDGIEGGRVIGREKQKLLQKREIFEEISKIRFDWTPKVNKVEKLTSMVNQLKTKYKKTANLVRRYKKALTILKNENFRLEKLVKSVAKEARGMGREGHRSKIEVMGLEEKLIDSQERLKMKDEIISRKDDVIESLRLKLQKMKEEIDKKDLIIERVKEIEKKREEERKKKITVEFNRYLSMGDLQDEQDNIESDGEEEEEEEERDDDDEVDIVLPKRIKKEDLLDESFNDGEIDEMENEIGEIMDSVHKWKDKNVENQEEYYDSSDEEKEDEKVVPLDIRKKIEDRNKRVMQILRERKMNE